MKPKSFDELSELERNELYRRAEFILDRRFKRKSSDSPKGLTVALIIILTFLAALAVAVGEVVTNSN